VKEKLPTVNQYEVVEKNQKSKKKSKETENMNSSEQQLTYCM
jgi:hypothetical protein